MEERDQLSAHANIYISSELSSESRLTKVGNSSTANSGGSGGASRAAQEVAPPKQVSTQSISLDQSVTLQAAPQTPVQTLPASNQGEGMVVLGVGTGDAHTQVANLRTADAPSASNPLGQEHSSVDANLPKQSNTGGTARRRQTRVPVRIANASLPVGGTFCISDRGMKTSVPG